MLKIQSYIQKSLFFALLSSGENLITKLHQNLKKEGLNFSQSLVLIAIMFEEDGLKPSELAETICMTKSNTSHCLNELLKHAFIERKMHRLDKRSYMIHITKSGRDKALKLIEIIDKFEIKIENHFGKEKTNNITLQIHELKTIA